MELLFKYILSKYISCKFWKQNIPYSKRTKTAVHNIGVRSGIPKVSGARLFTSTIQGKSTSSLRLPLLRLPGGDTLFVVSRRFGILIV